MAVHLHRNITSQVSAPDTAFVNALTVTASELTGAGFTDNDEVFVFAWVVAAGDGSARFLYRLAYNGSLITNASTPNRAVGVDPMRRQMAFMGRLNLSTLAEFEFDIASSFTSPIHAEKIELLVLRADDFGNEGTDWVWNKSTTDVAHSTTYSATNRAAVTIPASGATQDWIIFAYTHIAIDSTSTNAEARLMVDGVQTAGDWTEEGDSTSEEWTHLFFDAANLNTSTHTVAVETRDDFATAANNHRESALLAFRKNVWSDIFFSEPGTVAVDTDTDTQVATLTPSLSANLRVLILGQGNLNIDTVDQTMHMWVRKGGSTVIEPITDPSSGHSLAASNDATDEPQLFWFGYDNLPVGAQDLDLFIRHTGGATESLLLTKFMVWGLGIDEPEFVAGVATESDTATDVTFRTAPLFVAEQAIENDVGQDVQFDTTTSILPDLAVERDIASEILFHPEPRFTVEQAQESDIATEAVLGEIIEEISHVIAVIDSPVSSSSASFETVLTITAAELAAAGFANNDDAIVMFWGIFGSSIGGDNAEAVWQLTYNGTAVTNAATPVINLAAGSQHQAYMTRFNLATLADIDVDLRRGATAQTVDIRRGRMVVLRVPDLGIEGTDWFWNKSTTLVENTTAYSATSRAAVSWTPTTVEDWVGLFTLHSAMDSNTSLGEARLILDGTTLIAGDWSEEGNTLQEEQTFLSFGVIEDLATGSHALAVETRNVQFDSPQNSHRESAILLLRAAHYSNLFWHVQPDTPVGDDEPTQLATINNSVSAAMDSVLLAVTQAPLGVAQGLWAWMRQDDTTVLAPVTDTSQTFTLRNAHANETERAHVLHMASPTLADGVQNLDFFVEFEGTDEVKTFRQPTILLLGLSYTLPPPPPPIFEAEFATERNVAFQALLVVADDLSTVVVITILMPPTLVGITEEVPARGIGVVQQGDFKPKIYHPKRKIVRT